jgi:hypothetical protein
MVQMHRKRSDAQMVRLQHLPKQHSTEYYYRHQLLVQQLQQTHRCYGHCPAITNIDVSSCKNLTNDRWSAPSTVHGQGQRRICSGSKIQLARTVARGRKRTLQDHLSHIHKNWKVNSPNSPNSPWSIPSRDKEIDRMGIARRVTYVSTARSALITPRVMCLPLGW